MINMVKKILPAEPAKPEREVIQGQGVICDVCGKKSDKKGYWNTGIYDIEDTTVEMDIGTSFPGDHDVINTSFDICPTCFKDKLIPWLASQGATPTIDN